MMTQALPSLFVPHGAPTFALRPGAAGAALAGLPATFERPRAIVMVSAHWETALPSVGSADRLETIHDYWGFPEALYALDYRASGCKEAAAEVLASLRAGGFPAVEDTTRGLDHGAWIPLRLLYPEADVPVIPLSIQPGCGPAHHLALGRALADLPRRGFLIVGSGNLTHSLRDFHVAMRNGGTVPAYVRAFADWIGDRLDLGDTPALLDYRSSAPEAARAHPTEDHLLPLYVALGAAGSHYRVERVHSGVDAYVIAMDAFAFRPENAA